MVAMQFPADASCTNWPVLPLLIVDSALIGVILWRITHQVSWRSHPRRICFHLLLLCSCLLRVAFWISLCNTSILSESYAMLCFSNSLVLLCTAKIIFQWACAASAGQVNAQEMQRVRAFSLQHPLVFFHTIHLLGAVGAGVYLIVGHGQSPQSFEAYGTEASVLLFAFRGLTLLVCFLDLVAAMYVTCRLRVRLQSAAMSEDMKRKSAIQLSAVICCVCTALVLQIVMDLPVMVLGMQQAWRQGDSQLSFVGFCVLKFFVPALLLSGCFLYVMRRVEPREPARLAVIPQQAIVEFEECSAKPCMWCDHHRRFHSIKTTTLHSCQNICSYDHFQSSRTTFQSSMQSFPDFTLESTNMSMTPSTTNSCSSPPAYPFPPAPRLHLPPTLSSTTATPSHDFAESEYGFARSHAHGRRRNHHSSPRSHQPTPQHGFHASSTHQFPVASRTRSSRRALFSSSSDQLQAEPRGMASTSPLSQRSTRPQAAQMQKRRDSGGRFQVVHLRKEYVQTTPGPRSPSFGQESHTSSRVHRARFS